MSDDGTSGCEGILFSLLLMLVLIAGAACILSVFLGGAARAMRRRGDVIE